MNNIIETVWSLANEFVDGPKLVTINDEAIGKVAKDVVRWKEVLYANRASRCALWGYPKCIDPLKSNAMRKLFLYELIANSVNYCYWYGRYDIRPSGASSTEMENLLCESFDKLGEMKKEATIDCRQEFEIIVKTFIDKLCMARFPLIDRRVALLTELLNVSDLLSVIRISVQREDYSVDRWLEYLITSFPGYSKDLFLKRAFLFIMQMYRRCGVFGKEISRILVPADYQVPKVLRWLGCIEYKYPLDFTIDMNLLLAEGCSTECEIRAATIVACKRIADLAGCTCEEVDTYLWSKRKQCDRAFHLTITTNY